MAVFEWLQLGGLTMLVLALMSVTALTLILIKLWEFSEQKISNTEFVDEALQRYARGEIDQLQLRLRGSVSPLAQIILESATHLGNSELSHAQARERIERSAAEHIERSRHRIRTLDLIGTLAPLVGLLGTVLGMIEAFQALQAAGNRVEPSILSGGIWKALITTAAGLMVAIPVVAAAHYLDRKVARLQSAMESALTRLLTTPRKNQ